MKQLVLFFTLVLFSLSSFSQVSEIKSASSSSSISAGDFRSGSGSSNDACVDACFSLCFSSFTTMIVDALIDHHTYLLENQERYKRTVSFDLAPQISFDPDFKNIAFQPYVRGTWGVFSSDFRYNQLIDFENNSVGIYNTFDWIVLEMNVEPSPYFSFRLGAGLMFETYNSQVFNENHMEFNIHAKPNKVYFTIQGRNAYDYNKIRSAYSEVSFTGNYNLIESDDLYIDLMIGATYQNYYETVDIYSLKAGLKLNYH